MTPAKSSRAKRRPAPDETWGSVKLAEMGLTGGQQKVLAVLATVVGILLMAYLLVFVVEAFDDDPTPELQSSSPLGQARPAAYRAWPSLKQFAPIADRAADAKPLTVEEVFTTKTLKAGKITLKLGERQLDADCARVVWGEALTEALATAGCTQAARAQFVSADGRYVAQYALLNLESVTAADELVRQISNLYRGGWLLPLPSAQPALTGFTEASGHAMGHYLGLVWIGRADGERPEDTDDMVTLGLAVREAEKVVYRRVVAVTGVPAG
ncbi:hypothetical protein FDA94_22880 [Herbidospora galbida]|uniref:Uncharacterized protein n=1 Tax=Herbidospora galbida TaxID=2575442 RepID=A0A4U3MBN6_9ACTN|nr:hypothetical protein [Herbidospora galbida]TKK86070.1 hypothetical protein FDA94_22880 [Herbidospora galbida]